MGVARVWLSHRNQDRDEPMIGAPRAEQWTRQLRANETAKHENMGVPTSHLERLSPEQVLHHDVSSAAAEGACSRV